MTVITGQHDTHRPPPSITLPSTLHYSISTPCCVSTLHYDMATLVTDVAVTLAAVCLLWLSSLVYQNVLTLRLHPLTSDQCSVYVDKNDLDLMYYVVFYVCIM